ncbi:YDG/SRA domain-containing protein [Amycolatopsis sp. NPDC058986]|uniref:YDG/SRA domain-containing protein n=1 Tax=unclassified Amycolatopsis TaxID=2618356 RepID=UPI003670CC3A
MSLADIDRQHVLAAIAEYDELGRDEFLAKYGFGRSVRYVVVHEDKDYDSKALVGAAHGYATGQALRASEFSGGVQTVVARLTEIGFEFRDLKAVPKKEAKMRYGELPNVPPGTVFSSRKAAAASGVHRALIAGIVGTRALGAESIVASGGYEDDVDYGTVIIYTGHGGQDASGKQVKDQTFDSSGNAALQTSMIKGAAVRVIRGSDPDSPHAPDEGYRYDGLFRVEDAVREKGRRGYLVCRFRMVAVASAVDMIIAPEEALVSGEEQHPAPPTGNETPGRRSTTAQRIVRSTSVADYVKNLYDHTCQMCGVRLTVGDRGYSEGAHIQALGGLHRGPDSAANVLCLCPNCHVLFDYGALIVQENHAIVRNGKPDGTTLHIHPSHAIGEQYLAHHREAHS